MLTGDNNILGNATEAREETRKSTATEIMTLKITGIEMQSYAENQSMPTLQYVADRLCEDGDMASVELKSQGQASLPHIVVGTTDSILAKLNDYPYVFEINSKLRLAAVDGEKLAEEEPSGGNSSSSEEINELRQEIEAIKEKYAKKSELPSSYLTSSYVEELLSGYARTEDISSTYATKAQMATAIANSSNIQIVDAYSQTSNASRITLTQDITDYDFIIMMGRSSNYEHTSSTVYSIDKLEFGYSKIGIYRNDDYAWYKVENKNTLTLTNDGGGLIIKNIMLVKI